MGQNGAMSQTSVYQPGVCNIGPAEIRKRRLSGYVGLAVAVVFLVVAFALGWSAWWRLLVALPVFLSAQGFLQAAFHFCVGFATRGLYNFGGLGSQETVVDAEFRRKDQRKAMLITLLAFAIAIVVAVVAFFIPIG
jgi:fatty acid desaturase